jgi:hypothetical protein
MPELAFVGEVSEFDDVIPSSRVPLDQGGAKVAVVEVDPPAGEVGHHTVQIDAELHAIREIKAIQMLIDSTESPSFQIA